jgi:hypothetical protein
MSGIGPITGAANTIVFAGLSVDVAMPSLGTWYDASSITLGPGLWMVSASIILNVPGTCLVTARVFNGAASARDQPGAVTGALTAFHAMNDSFAIRLTAASTTLTLRAAANITGCAMVAGAPPYGIGGEATRILAVRLA